VPGDLQIRSILVKTMKKKDPERSRRAKEFWSRPGYRKKMSVAASKGSKKRWSRPEEIQKFRKLVVEPSVIRYFMNGYSVDEKGAYSYVKMICEQHNISPEKLVFYYERSNFVCECCSREAPHFKMNGSRGTKTKLCVDHDHDTGLVRGILCHSCNVALGLLDHDYILCEKLAEYLKREEE